MEKTQKDFEEARLRILEVSQKTVGRLNESVRLNVTEKKGTELSVTERVLRSAEWMRIHNEVQQITAHMQLMAWPIIIDGWSAITGIYPKGWEGVSVPRTSVQECHILSGILEIEFNGLVYIFQDPSVFVVPPETPTRYKILSEQLIFVTVFKPALPKLEDFS